MPTIQVKDAGGSTIYLNVASGAGTSGDPYVLQGSIPAGDNNIGNVDIVTMPTVTETNSSAIKTAVELIDNVVSGSEMQTDIVGALPAGTNNIGDVDIASAIPAGDNNIGNVDVVTMPTITETNSGAIKTAVELIDNVVSGSEMQVDVVGALPAGTADVGNVGTKNLTTIATGERQGSASAVQLPTVSCSLVRIKAVNSNAGNVYVGVSGVSKPSGTTDETTGLELDAGEDTGWLPTDNVNRFYIICDNAGDDITYMAMT